ncbi:7SK snRNA methylphosphate capping enzyme bin3-like [Pieris napi]|uniref:7SK snRNA methylphosphate capping enzyme bin3-like n=1 Tax=Pieris napi TaxID=78633 RepID=UPI001FBB214F|nr:7SK snRNA methylphosphate capping enzyme bin3-like [Pieris napi]
MGSPEKELNLTVSTSDNCKDLDQSVSSVGNNVVDNSDTSQIDTSNNVTVSDANSSKEEESIIGNSKKLKKKTRHGKKGALKENPERSTVRRLHHAGTKFKQTKKRAQSFPSISKFFLPYNRPRKEAFIPPTKFLLGGNISDPLNLNSLQDEDVNRAMNAVTPESSPLPTPPRHKAKIDVIIPPNIRDPLNLMEPLDNEEYEKRLEMQQRKKTPRKKPRIRRRTAESVAADVEATVEEKEHIKEPPPPEPSSSKSRKRSCSDSDNNSQKCKDAKKLRRMESLDKIVSPVVPQPGAWMRARPQQRTGPQERPASPHRTKLKSLSEGEQKLPTFHPKNSRYQYGNYDRYYGYRNLNAMMDIRLQVFEMHRHLFQNKDILDIGCNVGHISIAVARTLGAKSVVGIDIDNLLIGRARKNLHSFIPVPLPQPKGDDEKKTEDLHDDKKLHCDKCKEEKCDCSASEQKEKEDDKKGRKIKRPRKNRKAIGKPEGQCFFPMSMSMMYGPMGNVPEETTPATFPYNVTFKQGNYVPREDVAVGSMESPQFDLILCLSTTKWLHLNWGDAGIKRAFKRMFNDLRPGGKLVLEAQNWASYKKKKRLTPTIYENFNSIELFPYKFREYLLSPEVGFSKCCVLGVPQHASKGFTRPIQLYVKGDFTPSKARWSDAYAPSSHHKPEAESPRRTVYAPVAPAYRPSDDAPSCGAVTPYSPNLDCSADDSPFYNPRSDSYAPSYQPPRPTVYATIPSPLGSASPAASPTASPAPHASPALDPLTARGFPAPERLHDD